MAELQVERLPAPLPDPLPLWFGNEARPVFGWIHHPGSATARGRVVICPSVGLEAGFSHYLLRQVAKRLASLGFVVVRMEYPGTSDAADPRPGEPQVSAWLAGVEEAIALSGELTRAPLVLLGMRLGGLVATEVARASHGVDGLVLWDVPRSGTAYLREQRTRQQVSLGGDSREDKSLTAMGMTFSAEAGADLAGLDLRHPADLPASRVLLVERPGRRGPSRGARTTTGTPPDLLEAPDQDDLLMHQRLPRATEDAVVEWVDRTWIAGGMPLAPLPAQPRQSIPVPGGRERLVRLGPHGLFGVLTEPDEPRTSTTIVLVPDAHTPHSGLSRMWTDLARSWVRLGVPTLRFDFSGCADSEPRPGQVGHQVALVEHIDDLVDVVHHLSPEHDDVMLVGICSAAYTALESCYRLTPTALVVINPAFSFLTPESPPSARRRVRQHTRRVLTRPFGRVVGRIARGQSEVLRQDVHFPWDRWFEASYWRDSLDRKFEVLPDALWGVLQRLLLHRRPPQVFRDLQRRGIRTLLVAGDPDHQWVVRGAPRAFRRLSRSDRFEMLHLPGLDHSVLRSGQKERLASLLTDHVTRTLVAPRVAERLDQRVD